MAKWSETEDNFLVCYQHIGAHALAKQLNRSYSAVVQRAHHLRISLKPAHERKGRPMKQEPTVLQLRQQQAAQKPPRPIPTLEERISKHMAKRRQEVGNVEDWRRVPTGIRNALRNKILQRDDYRCAYCGAEANTVDHVVAIANGGPLLDEENLVAACLRCNSSKGARSAPGRLVDTTWGQFWQGPSTLRRPVPNLSPTARITPPSPFAAPEAS